MLTATAPAPAPAPATATATAPATATAANPPHDYTGGIPAMHTPFSPPAAVPAAVIAELCLRDLDRVERLRADQRIKLTPPPWDRTITLPSADYREVIQ